MNGRVYDYNLGRFMSVDPLIQSPTNSQSLNPYSYIMNNPLSGTDPSGYCAVHLQSQLVCSQSPFQDSIMPDGGPFIVKDNFSLSGSGNEKTNASESSSKNQDIGENVSGSVGLGTSEVAGTTIALPAASGVVELSLATIGRALLGTLSALTLSGDTPLEDKEMLTVFRGTTFTDEHMVHAETGILMSEAARQAYNEEMYASGDKMKAIVAASEANLIRHSELLRKYGGETGLAITQSDGSFTSREYPRSMFSVTTNENIAKQFAKGPGGKVYMARIPKGALVKQPLKSSNESEYFVRGMWNFEEYK